MPWGPSVVLVPLAYVQIGSSLSLPRQRPRGRESLRGPTDPVSSRAFLELILFVGCQPVAGEASLGKGDVECKAENRQKREKERKRKRREEMGERENEKERREVHGIRDWTQTGQDQTAINSPLDLSRPIPSIGPLANTIILAREYR